MDASILAYILNDDSDDEFDNIHQLPHRRPRIIRKRINWYYIYDNIDFQRRFRLLKHHVLMVLERIERKISYRTKNNEPIPPLIQILVTLRFVATGSFFICVADFCGISKQSAQSIVHKVLIAIAEESKDFIKFPCETNDLLRMQLENFNLSGFIRVIGAIDCFHVRIRSYGGEDAEIYRNRKGFFSINVQAIVNSRLELLDLVARWPGSTHDVTIFDNSRIKSRFESGEFENGLLLGDSGYACMPYLLTPLQNVNTPSEILYNESQIRTRTMVERCFGILGKMFPILTTGSRFWTPTRTMTLITACGVLYNISRLSTTRDVISNERLL
ncbi:putative nuclease HARBI1 [Prorops nasuta]|uniref:putative nuclease HARBI1 n=1 Tax=Prorops nasuta TaxID=863751 RepID=UPI0034CFCC59